MKQETLQKVIDQLDGMIATFGQAVVIGGRNQKETEAYELLKDARLKLIEDLEEQGAPGYEMPPSGRSHGVFVAGDTTIEF